MGCRPSYFVNYNCRTTYAWIPTEVLTASFAHTASIALNFSGTINDYTSFIAGQDLLARDAVFIKSDGRVYKTVALSISASFDIGFTVTSATSGSSVNVDTRQGKVLDGFSGLISGSRYFLSESYGKIANTIPTNKDSVVYQAGVAKSSTELIFYPDLLVLK